MITIAAGAQLELRVVVRAAQHLGQLVVDDLRQLLDGRQRGEDARAERLRP